MGNMLIRAAAPRPASLQRALAKLQTPPLACPRETPIGLIPATLLVLVGLWTANAADFTSEAWPLAVLFALPATAFIWSWVSQSQPKKVSRRAPRELVDRRPVLLHHVIVLPPQRRQRRILARPHLRPRLIAMPPILPRRAPRRQPRLIAAAQSA